MFSKKFEKFFVPILTTADDGFSGHDLRRPGLTRLIKDHDAGAFEQVLVVSRGRLYRGSSWEEPRWPFRVRTLAPWE